MAADRFRFGSFTLDCANRRLLRDGAPVELNARYFDALALLAREHGNLLSKERFLDEVWRGVPVTDEALTQCIRTLRRQLGDDAGRPRFIETVPKHGYRFVAALEPEESSQRGSNDLMAPSKLLRLGAAGTVGGGIAGLVGGLIYGLVGASQPAQPGGGAISLLLVLTCLTTMLAVMGAAGVAFGIAAGGRAPARQREWTILGGAAGGMLVGGFVRLLGLDAFNLLLGQAPADMTGASEGALIGGMVAISYCLASSLRMSLRRSAAVAVVLCGAAGAIIPLIGGRLMGGSLVLLGESFADSQLHLDTMGAMVGEVGFGPATQIVTAALEGALFGGCVVVAMLMASIRLRSGEAGQAQQHTGDRAGGEDGQHSQLEA